MSLRLNITGRARLIVGAARTLEWRLDPEPGEVPFSLAGTITAEIRDAATGALVVSWTSASAPIVITSAATRAWEWQLSVANVATLYAGGPSPRMLTYVQTLALTGVEPVVLVEGDIEVATS